MNLFGVGCSKFFPLIWPIIYAIGGNATDGENQGGLSVWEIFFIAVAIITLLVILTGLCRSARKGFKKRSEAREDIQKRIERIDKLIGPKEK